MATIVAPPEEPRPRRRKWRAPRFSLRTLLLGITVAGVAMGVVWRTFFYQQPDPIRAALDQTCVIDVTDRPLGEVMADLSRQHGIRIVLDEHNLVNAGTPLDLPISVNVPYGTLETVLDTVAREHRFVCVPTGDHLFLTARESAWEIMEVRGHDVTDFRSYLNPRGARIAPGLFNLIVCSVDPASWDMGGSNLKLSLQGMLTFENTADVHEQCAAFLAALRKAIKQPREAVNVVLPQFAARERAINRILKQKTSIHFAQMPLVDVFTKLRDRSRIEIQIDRKALDDAGVATSVSVTVDTDGLMLAEALGKILKPLRLVAVVDRGALLVTTRENAEDLREAVMYPVTGLLGLGSANAQQLSTALQKLDPTGRLLWESYFENVVVVSATSEWQQKSAQVLMQYRQPTP